MTWCVEQLKSIRCEPGCSKRPDVLRRDSEPRQSESTKMREIWHPRDHIITRHLSRDTSVAHVQRITTLLAHPCQDFASALQWRRSAVRAQKLKIIRVERSEMSDDLSDDEVNTAAPAVSAVGDEARVEYSRLATRFMGKAGRPVARLKVPDRSILRRFGCALNCKPRNLRSILLP